MTVFAQNKPYIMLDSPIIVALDYNDKIKALSFVDSVNPNDCHLKIGMQMFTLYGTQFIQTLHQRGFQVFLDLKFYDIPNTVAKAVKAAADIGVWMINVHASGGSRMMSAAKEALVEYGKDAPILIAVTVLTSMDKCSLQQVGINQETSEQVLRLSKLSKECNLDGVVCSAHEASIVKSACGNNFLLITPGIRNNVTDVNDQRRIMTPKEAINVGINYIVIGRPITCSVNPVLSLIKINRSIGWIK
ncbi:MAG: orotidine-5'-phosphate decarboxylase [Arsenophonus sp.]